MQISRNIVNGTRSKTVIGFWWESGLSSRNYLTTFSRPFVHYACLRLCSAIVHFIRNNCLYFVCYGGLAHVLRDGFTHRPNRPWPSRVGQKNTFFWNSKKGVLKSWQIS